MAHNDVCLLHLQWSRPIRCLDELSGWWCFPTVCCTMPYVRGQWKCSVVCFSSTGTTCGESGTYTAQQTPMYYSWPSTGTFSASGTGHHTPQQTLVSITIGQALKECCNSDAKLMLINVSLLSLLLLPVFEQHM